MKRIDNKYKTNSGQVIIEYLIVLATIITVIAVCTGAFGVGATKGLHNVQSDINKYVQQ